MIGAGAENHLVAEEDQIDCGSFFDQIDDLLDFPNSDDIHDDDAAAGLPSSHAALSSADVSHEIWSDSVFSGASSSHLSAELSVPYEDVVQLEWLSNFVEDSFAGESLQINKDDSSHYQFQTSSPVSVLESSSSCSENKFRPRNPNPDGVATGKHGHARSKRPRPPAFIPRPTMQLISLTCSVNSDSENHAESRVIIEAPQVGAELKKKKKIKFKVPTPPVDCNQLHDLGAQEAFRKCTHCAITTTPQWRQGPLGPKTLCNACGVRYKSGRLFPEYRPAASPTFVASLHSNSHKKVLEMRGKGSVVNDPMRFHSMELIPNISNPAMEYI